MIVFVVRDRPESGHEHEHEQSHEHVMRLAYGDIIGGISGDMFVAALLDLGLSLSLLKAELKKIPTLRFELKSNKKPVHSIRATQFRVICDKNDRPRSWQQIRQLIERGKVTPAVKETGLDIFTRLAQAEAKVHGVAVDKVHFHEVGATDSIVDIMAAAIGVQELGIEGFYFSTIPLGRGITRSQHGPLPVPGPATLELLKGLPVVGVDIESETVTPTGAAIVRSLGKNFGPQPTMVIEKIGYGTGQKEFVNRPNLFRLVLGSDNHSLADEEMVVIETNIDDMNPQFYDHVMDRLFAAGARDVYCAPIQMKKNRPATLLSVICETRDLDRLAAANHAGNHLDRDTLLCRAPSDPETGNTKSENSLRRRPVKNRRAAGRDQKSDARIRRFETHCGCEKHLSQDAVRCRA